MTVTLNGGISASAIHLLVNAPVDDPAPVYKIDNEAVLVRSTQELEADGALKLVPNYTRWTVERGQFGTTKATHADGATMTPLYPQVGNPAIDTGGGAAEAGTVDLGDDVLIYQGSGPPTSTSGAGRQKFVDVLGGLVYDAGADAAVPDWTVLPGVVVLLGRGVAADPSAGAGVVGSEGDWYVQNLAGPVFGWEALLWIKGPGGDTDWSINDSPPIGIAAPVSAAAAFGVGEAGRGSKYIDRSNPAGDVEWSQVGTITAPVWTPQIASVDTTVTAAIPTVQPGIIRLINITLPSGDGVTAPEGTYENIRALLSASGMSGGERLGFPYPMAVRIGALFHHVLSVPTQAAGIRLRWDEVNYLFYADKPVADPDTGVITYTELGASDTDLAGALVQLLLIAYTP